MNKKMVNLNAKIAEAKERMANFLNVKNIAEAESVKVELDNLKKELALETLLFDDEREAVVNTGKPLKVQNKDEVKTAFFNALKTIEVDNAMVSKDNEAGGYTVPEDIRTRINQFVEQKGSIIPYIRTTKVTTESGADTFQKRSSGKKRRMRKVDERGRIGKGETPEFARIEWRVQKYADRYIASNELLNDSDANIENVMVEWIGEVLRVTENEEVFGKLEKGTKVPVKDFDDVKLHTNVTLDPGFDKVYFTNQSGYQVVATWKYEDGRSMLQPNATVRSGFSLDGREIVVFSNNDLPSDNNKAPFIIGDLKEAIDKKDRMKMSVRASDIAGEAWETDSVEWRAVDRFDIVMRDDKAFVYGELQLPAAVAKAETKKRESVTTTPEPDTTSEGEGS